MAATDEAGSALRKIGEPHGPGAQCRKVSRQAGPKQLVDTGRRVKILEPKVAELANTKVIWKTVADDGDHGPRHQHLTAVAGGADARGTVDLEPDVVAVPLRGLAEVKSHADPDIGTLRPSRSRQCSLALRRGAHRLDRAPEYHEEGVALRANLEATVACKGVAQDGPMPVEQLLVFVGPAAGETRRTLDIGKQEGDRPGRRLEPSSIRIPGFTAPPHRGHGPMVRNLRSSAQT